MHKDLAIPGRRAHQASAAHMKSRAFSALERRGDCHQAYRTSSAQTTGFRATDLITIRRRSQGGLGQLRFMCLDLIDANRPKTCGYPRKIRGIGDLLVTQQLRPSPGGSIG